MDAPQKPGSAAAPAPRDASVGFGVERLGLAALRAPLAAAAMLAVAVLVAAFGVPQLRFDDNLQNIFDSGAPQDAAYRDLARNFSVGEAEILLLAEAPSFARLESLEALRRAHFEAQLLDGVASVTSIFSLRAAPQDGAAPPPVLGPDLSGEEVAAALARVDAHPFNLGKLLSHDRRLALISVRPSEFSMSGQRRLIAELTAAVNGAVAGSGVEIAVTGIPVVRIEIVRRLLADSIRLNLFGAAIAIAIGMLLFQSLRLTAIAVAPPILAAATVLGGMGLAGVGVNAMTIVIPVLILVMVFADSMHLTFAWMQRRRDGATAQEAARAALIQVGPACVLATATTVIAFGAIAVSKTYIITEFGLAGAVANVLGLGLLLVAHPILCLVLGSKPPSPRPARGIHAAFIATAAATARMVAARPRAILMVGIAITLVAAVAHANLAPNYSIREHLPADETANAALGRLDRHLNGAFAVQFPVPLPRAAAKLDPATLEEIRTVHAAVQETLPGAAVFSPWSFAEWLGARNTEDAARRIAPLWEDLSAAQRRRLLDADGAQALVTTWIREYPAVETDRLVARIEAAIAERGPRLHATGLVVHSARKSQSILQELNLSLLAAVALAIALVALAFRSLAAGLVSILPNVLPILVTGTFLLLTRRGLQFASVLALTIAFGIAVNDTVHYLNRYRRDRAEGLARAAAAPEAVRGVGPVMIATTVVLCAGMSATLFSGLPMTALFGTLCVILLMTALVADLVFLPSLILEYPRRWKKDF